MAATARRGRRPDHSSAADRTATQSDRDVGIDIFCFSYLAYTLVCDIPAYPPPNSGAPILNVTESVSGDGPIVALIGAGLGLKCALMSNHVGQDAHGRSVVRLLDAHCVTRSARCVRNTVTPTSVILVDDLGQREWFTQHGEMNMARSVIHRMMRGSSFSYVDAYPDFLPEAARFIESTRETGTRLYVNIGEAVASQATLDELAGAEIDVVQASATESQDDAGAIAVEIREKTGAMCVAVTVGALGAVLAHPTGLLSTQAVPVRTLHTHGAGAGFSAGFLMGLVRGLSHEECLRNAAVIGAQRCARPANEYVFL